MGEHKHNSYDINGLHFNSDLYFDKLLKECNLRQIMDQETEIIKDTQNLHSDMQTLVYENYNKFISATDTVRKMKLDFKKMEDEMDLLVSNMDSITKFSEQISSTLQDSRQKISKLSSVHSLLKRLQFLFKLPTKLNELIDKNSYTEAVNEYLHAQRVLQQYGSMPSFQGIQEDCNAILEKLKQKLRDQFKSDASNTKQLINSIELLLQIGEPKDMLAKEFLENSQIRLKDHLTNLENVIDKKDIIDYVELSQISYLNDLTQIISSFRDMFINKNNYNEDNYDASFEEEAINDLNQFIILSMEQYLFTLEKRFELEKNTTDIVILVRALDRFYRRLLAVSSLCKEHDFANVALNIVKNVARKQCENHLNLLLIHFGDVLTKVRQHLLIATPNKNYSIQSTIDQQQQSNNLNELLSNLIFTNVEKIKGILQDLMVFIQPDISFSLKSQFRDEFCLNIIRYNLIIGFLKHILKTALSFCDNKKGLDPKSSPTLLLLLSKMCLEFQKTSIRYLLNQTDELFELNIKNESNMKLENQLHSDYQNVAKELLNNYVRMQGLGISQMLRKSVETRDWLHTIEPRTVRAVMKRVVEDIAQVDNIVGVLFEDGSRTEHSSDSSRKTHSISVSRHRSNWSNYNSNQLTTNPSIHKLFSEKVEIFSTVEFTKSSIITGIIKISLKTFLECIRLKTFSKYGLQQIQVDAHYLQLYLWRFVSDENLVHYLLDEILGSAVHRCLEPVLMEPSVVEIICERG